VANDAGMGHMAGAMGVPVISLFGPTSASKQAPFCPDGVVVRSQEFGGDTMDAIPVDAVVRAIETFYLARPPQPHRIG
jgi:ADP-heptose:LPS heptosyltransferase